MFGIKILLELFYNYIMELFTLILPSITNIYGDVQDLTLKILPRDEQMYNHFCTTFYTLDKSEWNNIHIDDKLRYCLIRKKKNNYLLF